MSRELDDGGDVPFSFEEHQAPGSPTLYEYRPLVKPFLDARAGRFAALADAQPALAELEREPAAAVFAQAHSSGRPSSREALTRTVLLPLLAETAEACGGFDWDDSAFDRVYAAFEASLFGSRRAYGAIAPLVGLSVGGGRSISAAGSAFAMSPRASWPRTGRRLEGCFRRGSSASPIGSASSSWRPSWAMRRRRAPAAVPDAPGELADAITALRLATAGAIAAGPVLFERLDWRPYGIRPVLPIAATAPPGEGVRLDPVRGRAGPTASRAALGGGRRPRSRRGARPVGALALPDGSLRLGAAARRR